MTFGDEIPIKKKKKITLNECIKIKVQQILAKEKKIIDNINYSEFIKRYQNENERRKQALKNKKIVYGTASFTVDTYFNYTFSIMVEQLKQRLAEKDFDIQEDDLRKYYQTHKEKYKNQDSIKVVKISAYYYNPESLEQLMSKDKARRHIEKVYNTIIESKDFIAAINGIKNSKISIENQQFNQSTAFVDNRLYETLRKRANSLSAGELSQIIEDEYGFHILKCIKRINSGYLSFNEIRESIQSKIIDEKYQELIEKRINEANIKINHSLYKSIKEI